MFGRVTKYGLLDGEWEGISSFDLSGWITNTVVSGSGSRGNAVGTGDPSFEKRCSAENVFSGRKESIRMRQTRQRVFVFEESSKRGEILSRFLKARGYEPVVFSSLSYFTDGPWSMEQKESDQPRNDVAISSVHVPLSAFASFYEPRIRKAWGIKHIALMRKEWSDDEKKLAVELKVKLFGNPFTRDNLSGWLDEVRHDTDGGNALPGAPDVVPADAE